MMPTLVVGFLQVLFLAAAYWGAFLELIQHFMAESTTSYKSEVYNIHVIHDEGRLYPLYPSLGYHPQQWANFEIKNLLLVPAWTKVPKRDRVAFFGEEPRDGTLRTFSEHAKILDWHGLQAGHLWWMPIFISNKYLTYGFDEQGFYEEKFKSTPY